MVPYIKCHYQKVIQAANMIKNFMPIFVACIICVFVVYLSNEWDFPRKLFLHGYECSGQIGGGCEKD